MQTTDVTHQLARWIVDYPAASLPEVVKREGLRTVVNWFGCAIGGSPHETVDRALNAVRLFTGPAQATVFGRGRELDALHAALLNGITSHVLDYDDTHLKTIIHPAGPVAAAAFAVAEMMPVTGADLLTAIILGIETECRIGNSVYPDHYDRGWHITGTAGVFGAAAAVGRLLGLDRQKMTWALGIAATAIHRAFAKCSVLCARASIPAGRRRTARWRHSSLAPASTVRSARSKRRAASPM